MGPSLLRSEKSILYENTLITDANAFEHPPKIRKPGAAGDGQMGPSLLRPEKSILYEISHHGR